MVFFGSEATESKEKKLWQSQKSAGKEENGYSK
jgi:hypothetical protein